MNPKRNVADLSDEELIKALLDCQHVLQKAEMAFGPNPSKEGEQDEEGAARARAEIGIAQDAREVFGKELLRRLAERS